MGNKAVVRKSTSRRVRLGPLFDGAARIFDFMGSMNRRGRALPPDVADAQALRRDWEAVGGDLRTVIAARPPGRSLNDRQGAAANR